MAARVPLFFDVSGSAATKADAVLAASSQSAIAFRRWLRLPERPA